MNIDLPPTTAEERVSAEKLLKDLKESGCAVHEDARIAGLLGFTARFLVDLTWAEAREKKLHRITDVLKTIQQCECGMGAKVYKDAINVGIGLDVQTTAEKRIAELEAENAKLQARLDFLKEKGLVVGMMKTSDKPEPYLAYSIESGSELDDTEQVMKMIELEAEVERLRAEVHDCPKCGRACKQCDCMEQHVADLRAALNETLPYVRASTSDHVNAWCVCEGEQLNQKALDARRAIDKASRVRERVAAVLAAGKEGGTQE